MYFALPTAGSRSLLLARSRNQSLEDTFVRALNGHVRLPSSTAFPHAAAAVVVRAKSEVSSLKDPNLTNILSVSIGPCQSMKTKERQAETMEFDTSM